ncbi:MAG: hypothetical protein DRI37_09285 [Chloroflexi bacterium]|nr:MAG: hypothetical protein DRI37_09285 [Chloroflexota bacterium]
MKYRLSGPVVNYKDTWYKRPASLIKRLMAAQDIHDNEISKAALTVSLNDDALAEMTKQYPDCEVTAEGIYKPGFGRGVGHRGGYTVDVIMVKTGNGRVMFTFRRKDDEIVFDVYRREVTNVSINTTLTELIIGKAV